MYCCFVIRGFGPICRASILSLGSPLCLPVPCFPLLLPCTPNNASLSVLHAPSSLFRCSKFSRRFAFHFPLPHGLSFEPTALRFPWKLFGYSFFRACLLLRAPLPCSWVVLGWGSIAVVWATLGIFPALWARDSRSNLNRSFAQIDGWSSSIALQSRRFVRVSSYPGHSLQLSCHRR